MREEGPVPNKLLKQARRLKGWTQSELAEKLDTNFETISRWERGTITPSLYYQKKLADVFEKTVEGLGLSLEHNEEVPHPHKLSNEFNASEREDRDDFVGRDQFIDEIAEAVEVSLVEKHPDKSLTSVDQRLWRGLLGRTGLLSSSLLSMRKRTTSYRKRMLRRLARTYRTLLDNSLQGIAWMELGLSEHPDAIRNATHLLQPLPSHTEQAVPAGTSILSIYDQAEEELLILGAPGAGKSMLLLKLASSLIARAEVDETAPIPVIVPLTSWATSQGKVADWLVEQLDRIYGVARDLARQWVEQGLVLPLLDGLDEMEEAARPLCVAAINAYHAQHITPLVVCSRKAEYDVASTQERLVLQEAVIIQALTEEQVADVIHQGDSDLAGLREAFLKNPTMRELATNPLMLSVLVLTYRGTTISDLHEPQVRLEERIWTDYVERMVCQKGANRPGYTDPPVKRYQLAQTCVWLSWLARQMRVHHQTIFYLEHLQPDWLPEAYQYAYIWLGVLLPGILIGGLTCPVISLFLGLGVLETKISFVRLLHIGLLGGLVGGLFSSTLSRRATSSSSSPIPLGAYYTFKVRVGLSILIGLAYNLCNGLLINQPDGLGGTYKLGDWLLRDGCIFGGTIGLSSWLLITLFMRDSLPQSQDVPSGIRRFGPVFDRLLHCQQRQRVLLVAVILGGGSGLINGLENGLVYRLGVRVALGSGLGYGLIQAIWFGLTGVLVSIILKGQARDIHLAERLRWTRNSLTRSMFAPKHFKATMQLVCFFILLTAGCIGLGSGLSHLFPDVPNGVKTGLRDGLDVLNGVKTGLRDGFSVGLGTGLSVGLSYWFLFGLFQSIIHEQVEDQERQFPNQGIHRSFRTCAIMGVIGGGTIGSISILAGLGVGLSNVLDSGFNDLSKGLTDGLNYGLNYGWSILCLSVLSGGLVICALSGGLAVLRHFVLRLLLSRMGNFPWQAVSFLEDAKTRTLLQRVGGGYSFIHRLLLDYFADLDSETPSR